MAVWLREEAGPETAAPTLLLYRWRDDGVDPAAVLEDVDGLPTEELHAALRRFVREG